jgi:hypothetical protein
MGQGRSKRIEESKEHIHPGGWDRGGLRESKRVKYTPLQVDERRRSKGIEENRRE